MNSLCAGVLVALSILCFGGALAMLVVAVVTAVRGSTKLFDPEPDPPEKT